MRKWLTIIVDDQQSSIDNLTALLKDIEYVDVVEVFQEPQKALTYLRINPVDFIILDVELGEIDGFDFLTRLPDPRIPTLLYTAHQQYEDRGYDMNLVDVLLKPVTASRLKGALRRVNRELRDMLGQEEEDSLDNWYDYFFVKGPIRNERKLVWLKNIVYVESISRKVYIFLADGRPPLVCNMSLRDVIDKLPKRWFKQCHQSYAFNINFFDSYKNNEVTLTLLDKKLMVGDRTIYMEFSKFLEIDLK